eukprot:s24_g17.t1
MSGSAAHGKVGLAGNLRLGIGRAGKKPRQQHVARSGAASSQAPEATSQRTSPARFDPAQYYEEIRHLGSGAFGAAVLVRRLRDGRRLVAKKCSVKEMAEKQRKMCLEEIALLQKVRHECVAQLVDVVWTSQDMLSYWIVLKFYPGGDVQKEIDDCRENEFELPLGKAKNWVTQLCMALKHVHSLRIVHRDVKGSNMFITGARNIVLGDFGVSKQLSESQQKAMTSVGSPMYMAPEWWDGRGGTAASDMWSVGVVLYELLALRRPFEAQNVLSLVHKITTEEPPALDDDADQQLATLAMRLLQKRPESRPSASQALGLPGLDDVEKILGIYRGALEKKSDKQQRKKAREEDAASGKKPRRPSRSSSSELDSSGSGSMAGLRGINLADIARRQTGTSVPAVAEGPVETDDEDEDASLGSESSEEGLSASDEEVAKKEPAANESSDSLDSWRGGVHVAEPGDLQHPEQTAWPVAAAGDGVGQQTLPSAPEAALANDQLHIPTRPCTGSGLTRHVVHSLVTPAMVQHLSVAIHGLSGRCLQLQVKPEDAIGRIKQQVGAAWQVPAMCLQLSLDSHLLEDLETLGSRSSEKTIFDLAAVYLPERLYEALDHGKLLEKRDALVALPSIAAPGDRRSLLSSGVAYSPSTRCPSTLQILSFPLWLKDPYPRPTESLTAMAFVSAVQPEPRITQQLAAQARSARPTNVPAERAKSHFPCEGATALVGMGVLAAARKSRRCKVARGAVASARPTVDDWMVKPVESQDLIAQSRPAHWVLRTTDVKANLRFLTKIFGMKVLRHEEFEKPCAITCNGDFETPWSKTMIGYGPEDEGYCLELTYNYGVSDYEPGTGLAHIAVAVANPEEALKTAADMGYTVDADIITGPDGYKFRVLPKEDARKFRSDIPPRPNRTHLLHRMKMLTRCHIRFVVRYIALKVGDLDKAARFYCETCGMDEVDAVPDCPIFSKGAKVVRYPQQLPLVLFLDKDTTLDSAPPQITQWEGRHAIAIPGKALRAIYKRIIDSQGAHGSVLHHIREFNELPALRRMRGLPPMACSPSPEEQLEKLRTNPLKPPPELESGTLAVAIVKDADGYERFGCESESRLAFLLGSRLRRRVEGQDALEKMGWGSIVTHRSPVIGPLRN